MRSPTAPLDLTLKCQSQVQSHFEARKAAGLGHMLLLNINMKRRVRSSMALSH